MNFSFRKAYKRHQTLLLAAITFVLFIWAAIDVFDVSPAVIKQLLLFTIMLLGGVIVVAGGTFMLVLLIKHWLRRK